MTMDILFIIDCSFMNQYLDLVSLAFTHLSAACYTTRPLLHLPLLLTSQAPCIYQLDALLRPAMTFPLKFSLWNLM